MLNPPFAEKLLARAVGPARAAAIYGDLLELAATRGRLWFLAAYARTLLSLTWRTPVALITASVCTYWLGPIVWRSVRMLGHHYSRLTVAHPPVIFLYTILGNALVGLFFLLPFLMIRFGLRDRMTRLAAAIFLVTLPYFSFVSTVVLVVGPLMAMAFLVALCLRDWRRPMIVLALALVPQYVVVAAWMSLPRNLLLFHLHGRIEMMLPRLTAFAVTAMVCVYLHDRLLRTRSKEAAHA